MTSPIDLPSSGETWWCEMYVGPKLSLGGYQRLRCRRPRLGRRTGWVNETAKVFREEYKECRQGRVLREDVKFSGGVLFKDS